VPLSAALGAIVGLAIILALFSAVMLGMHWAEFYTHGSFYCGVVVVGTIFSYISALVILPTPTDALCLAFPWLLGVGFTLVYGCLFIKTWALYKVWKSAEQLKKANLTPMYIVKGIGIYMVVEVIILVIWSAIDRPKAKYEKMIDNSYELQCRTEHATFWAIFLGTKGAWLIFGAMLSILTRSLAQQFNKSKNIAFSIYNIAALLIIAVPLAIMLQNVSGGVIIIQVGVILIAFTFTMISLFFDIWYHIFFPTTDVIGGLKLSNLQSSTATSNRSSKSSSKDSSAST